MQVGSDIMWFRQTNHSFQNAVFDELLTIYACEPRLLNQWSLAFGVRAMEFVELGRQQREQLFDRQRMQIPCQIKLAQDICKAARAAGAFGAQSGAIASMGSVVIKTRGNSHDGVAGDKRWS